MITLKGNIHHRSWLNLSFLAPLARFNKAMLAYYVQREQQYDRIIGPRAIVIPASLCKMKAKDGSAALAEICT